MNEITREIKAYVEHDEDYLAHYGRSKRDGAPHGSGRYPLGSGDDPFQHDPSFLGRVKMMEKQGMSEKQIAEAYGLTTTQLRLHKSLARSEERAKLVRKAEELEAKGLSRPQIAKEMGFAHESSVRSLLNEGSKERMNQAKETAMQLKKLIDEKGMLDVGAGVEAELGISHEKLEQALHLLEVAGYPTYGRNVEQITNPGKYTTTKVLCPPGSEHKDVYTHEITSVSDYITSDDNGKTYRPSFQFPESLDSKRLGVVYAEDGGTDKDGVIELRRGVKDLSLGNANYAQVRIMVDGTHYLKGMAVYSDDLPDGIDVLFNTNKHAGTPILGPKDNSVLKPVKKDKNGNVDRDNPFGSLIKEKGGQSTYVDDDGKKKLSLINKRAEEGDWNDWDDKLPSQFLAKQSTDLIRKQLKLTMADRYADYDEIMSYTNPIVRKKFLNDFAEECDTARVHLKASALPRQKYQVILPLKSIKDNEVYAPNFNQGEKVALIRFPHSGPFEIPILTVNNRNEEGKKVIGAQPLDAVGINSKVASRLSGADFDGDTVMVVPTRGNGKNLKVNIISTYYKGLEGFDPKEAYPKRPGMKVMTKDNTQKQMGVISNLITDMTIKGASEKELTWAVKHSMVVIDAEKHSLDYKKSEVDNHIDELKRKYQKHTDDNGYGGASTLLSRAKSETHPLATRGNPWTDPETGKLLWERINPETGKKESKIITEPYKARVVDKNGNVKEVMRYRRKLSTQMADTDDARTLISDRHAIQEVLYAQYANALKALANKARKEALSIKGTRVNKEAKKTFASEILSLNEKLKARILNKPKERLAQRIAGVNVESKKLRDPTLREDKGMLKKVKQQELTKARTRVGAKRTPVVITEKEWEAIQAGRVSDNILTQILMYSEPDTIRKIATPPKRKELSTAQMGKIKSMRAAGYSTSAIAESLGVSRSTITNVLKPEEN